MTHQLHERTIQFVEARKDGRRQTLISSRPYREVAQRYIQDGWECDLVTEKTTWRGQNGKRKHEELSRERLTAT